MPIDWHELLDTLQIPRQGTTGQILDAVVRFRECLVPRYQKNERFVRMATRFELFFDRDSRAAVYVEREHTRNKKYVWVVRNQNDEVADVLRNWQYDDMDRRASAKHVAQTRIASFEEAVKLGYDMVFDLKSRIARSLESAANG